METGGAQGDPASGPGFNIDMHPSLQALDEKCSRWGGLAKAGADNVYAVGPPAVVLAAVREFATDLQERCCLSLQWSKSEVFAWRGELPEEAPPGLGLAGEDVEGFFRRGILVYGIPVGEDEYVSKKFRERAEDIVRDAEKTANVLVKHRQAFWSALYLTISQRFMYFLQLSPPSLVEPVAEWLDCVLWGYLERCCGFAIPVKEEQGGLVLQVPVDGLDGRTFQEWTVRLPIRLWVGVQKPQGGGRSSLHWSSRDCHTIHDRQRRCPSCSQDG